MLSICAALTFALLQAAPGAPQPFTGVQRIGDQLEGRVTPQGGYHAERVYLVQVPMSNVSVTLREPDLTGFVSGRGSVIASATVSGDKFSIDLAGKQLSGSDYHLATAAGDIASVYAIDYTSVIQHPVAPPAPSGPDPLWTRVGLPLLIVLLIVAGALVTDALRRRASSA